MHDKGSLSVEQPIPPAPAVARKCSILDPKSFYLIFTIANTS